MSMMRRLGWKGVVVTRSARRVDSMKLPLPDGRRVVEGSKTGQVDGWIARLLSSHEEGKGRE